MMSKFSYKSIIGFIFFTFQILITNAEVTAVDQCRYIKPHILESSDGKLRFIQLPAGISELKINDVVYTRSGLYLTEGAPDPVWTINEFFKEDAISNDGIFVVGSFDANEGDRNPRSRDAGGSHNGLKFYKRGELFKKYGVRELVDKPEKIIAPSDIFSYPWMTKPKFDPERNLLFIKTLDYNLYVFDITTGDIIGAQSNWRNYKATIVKLDGEQLDFENLHKCHAISTDKEYSIKGLVSESQTEHQANELIIPFNKIARVENTSQRDSQVTNVLLYLHNGENIQVDASEYTLCGRPSRYTPGLLPLHMKDVASITDIHELKSGDRASHAYPEISPELLEYYHKEDDKAGNWNKLLNENYQSVAGSTGDNCEINLANNKIAYKLTIPSNWRPISSGRECDYRLAGYGKRSRAICYDLVYKSVRGPLMVVVPAGSDFEKPFAIGKYEISVKDWSIYCELSGRCEPVNNKNKLNQPMAGISLEEARQYARWLSKRTLKTYRLPTSAEWVYAASAMGNKKMKKDFNCRTILGDRVIKGADLVSIKSGRANDWGLINIIGNIQEWVMEGDIVMVRGGAFTDSYSDCDISLSRPHSGDADEMTGFRLMLEDVL